MTYVHNLAEDFVAESLRSLVKAHPHTLRAVPGGIETGADHTGDSGPVC